jgi:PAS domain S-box-containing protein
VRAVIAGASTAPREPAAGAGNPLDDVDIADGLAAFAKVVAHDFSSPLQSVRGFGILLLDTLGDRIDDQERGYLGEMVIAAERMQELNDGLTTWVRARNATLDVREVSLESIVAECVEAFRARAVAQGASISVSPLPPVQADATAIRHVLHHLLDNALRYATTDRTPAIHIEAMTRGAEVVVVVRDNGPGIADESRERAFGLFKRLESSREAGSAGIGLTLSRTIIERHGGRLWLDAAPGGGLEAIFTLPTSSTTARVTPDGSTPVRVDESTERRQRHQRAALATIVELSDDAIFSKDLSGHIITWNRAAEMLYGYSAADVTGQHVSMLMASDRLPELPDLMSRVRLGERMHLETVRLRKDGTQFDVALTISPIRDPQGDLVGASVIARDVTERHQAEEDLRAFLEVAPDAIVVINREGAIHAVNSQTEATFGYRADEMIGQPLEMLLPERFRDEHVAHRMAFAIDAKPRPMGTDLELFGLRRDGIEFPADIQLSTIPTKDGRLPVAVIRDVTERRRLEHLRDDFVANAAHELRTPLTTLAGLGETLSRSFDVMDRADIEEAFAAMARQGERARVLIANLLDLSNIEGGRTNFTIVNVELRPLVERVLEAAPPPDGKTVAVAVASGVAVRADPDRLSQVVTNLLVNAYRYGGSQIRIHAPNGGSQVVLAVTDDGTGIERDLVPKLFEPFTRGRQASVVRGSGIGLALCRRIVEGMDGEIRYEQIVPRGSSFRVSLRRAM